MVVALIFWVRGSSPRMRGAHRWRPLGGITSGIIPADAGSTGSMNSRQTNVRDHPRGCGEHHEVLITDVDPSGSSPRMRGALPHA